MSKPLAKCVKQQPTKFTIHGFLPCNKTNPQPNSCIAHEPLKWEHMKCVSMIDFDNCWSNLNNDVNNINRLQLWTHEWNKHGTCSSMYPKDYYNLAFKINKDKDIKSFLQNKGIQPGGLKQKKSVSMYK
uniref:Ribonuclease Phyb-like n=1 Tax=Cicer arietinum TaxID=3827 RepID=A0A1S3DW17_CICAR